MAINWKNRAKQTQEELVSVRDRAKDVGFALVKEKDAHRKAATDLMSTTCKLMRAVAAIDSATETCTAHGLSGHAATFRIIANDLRPARRDAEGIAGAKAEQI